MSIVSVSVTLPGGVGMLEPRVGRVTGLNRAGVRTPRESTVVSRAVVSRPESVCVQSPLGRGLCTVTVGAVWTDGNGSGAASRRAATFLNIQSLNELT